MNLREQLQRTLGTTYTVERELGGGGMARVYLAEEPALERRVVVKVLFGVAKALSAAADGVTTAGVAMGTPAYMAPVADSSGIS